MYCKDRHYFRKSTHLFIFLKRKKCVSPPPYQSSRHFPTLPWFLQPLPPCTQRLPSISSSSSRACARCPIGFYFFLHPPQNTHNSLFFKHLPYTFASTLPPLPPHCLHNNRCAICGGKWRQCGGKKSSQLSKRQELTLNLWRMYPKKKSSKGHARTRERWQKYSIWCRFLFSIRAREEGRWKWDAGIPKWVVGFSKWEEDFARCQGRMKRT